MNARETLRRATGLDLPAESVERAVRKRMARLGLPDRAAYCRLLAGAELDALAELVVVPESWMFRDPAAFDAAVEVVRERLARQPGHVVRILSLPCAGGEEPYSMAMALLDAGLPLQSCRIEGIDLSAAAIERARAARYTRNAFRSADLGFRERYFTQAGNSYLLRDDVRHAVHFSQGNLMALDTPANAGRYDLVFCRNLLIYFDGASTARAIAALAAVLAPGGVLFSGAAETPAFCRHGFAALPRAGAFALQKQGGPAAPLRLVPAVAPAPRVAAPAPAPSTVAPTAALLALAQRQADAGDLAQAAASCSAALAADPASPDAHFILGMVSQCQGDEDAAERHWRRCVYLDPAHYEALCALALLAEQAGGHGVAAVYRQRAARVQGSDDGSRAA
jgi:chemotaxis protein methyltransferase WspC